MFAALSFPTEHLAQAQRYGEQFVQLISDSCLGGVGDELGHFTRQVLVEHSASALKLGSALREQGQSLFKGRHGSDLLGQLGPDCLPVVGAQVAAANAKHSFDPRAVLGRDAALYPVGESLGADAEECGRCGQPALIDGLLEGLHGAITRHVNFLVNNR